MKKLFIFNLLFCLSAVCIASEKIKGVVETISVDSVVINGSEYELVNDVRVTLGALKEEPGHLIVISEGAEVYLYLESKGKNQNKVKKIQMIGSRAMIEDAKKMLP